MNSPFLECAARVLLNDHPLWSVDTFNVTLFRDVDATQPVLTDICTFVKKDPSIVLQQNPKLEETLYFPPSVVPIVKSAGSKVESTNVHDYLNDASC